MAPKTKSRTAIWFYAKECMDNGKIKVNNVRDAIEGIYPEYFNLIFNQISIRNLKSLN